MDNRWAGNSTSNQRLHRTLRADEPYTLGAKEFT